MLYLCIEITGYQQLLKVEKGISEELYSLFDKSLNNASFSILSVQGDLLIYGRETEEKSFPNIFDSLMDIHSFFMEKEKRLQGYSLLLDSIEEPLEQAFPLLQKKLYSTFSENSCFLGEGLRDVGEHSFSLVREGHLFRLTGKRVETRVKLKRMVTSDYYLRKGYVEELSDILNSLAKGERPLGWISLTGPSGCGKRMSLYSALHKTFGTVDSSRILIIYCTGKEQSWMHPFLNSICHNQLDKISEYLTPEETLVWNRKKDLLDFLCPDHVKEDFLIVYSLYLTAYIRSMKEKSLLPLIICEDLEDYNPETLLALNRLWRENLNQKGVVPVSITFKECNNRIFGSMEYRISFQPVQREDLTEYCKHLYPDLKINLEDLDLSRIKAESLVQYLYLLNQGFIKGFPENINNLFYLLLHHFTPEERRVLGDLYLSQGMLSQEEFSLYERSKGIPMEEYEQIISKLQRLYIIRMLEYPRIIFPRIDFYLVPSLGKEFSILVKQLSDYLFSRWNAGTFSRLRSLYDFYNKYDDSIRAEMVLIALVEKYLDEGTANEALRCIRRIGKNAGEKILNKKKFRSLLIRTYTLMGEIDKARELCIKEGERNSSEEENEGDLELEIGRYYLAVRDLKPALVYIKKAVLLAQGRGNDRLASNANIEIGLVMLLTDRCEEAIDYFRIAREVAEQSSLPFERIRSSAYEVLALIFFGNLSKALREVEGALQFVERANRREWQLYLLHLKGRIYFELGIYERAEMVFESAIKLCDTYSFWERKQLFISWQNRSKLYREGEDPVSMMNLPNKNQESLFFLAEAFILKNQFDTALVYLNDALKWEIKEEVFFPGEVISWENGFSSFEDRVIVTPERMGFLHHLIRAYRGYVMGLLGDNISASEELLRITREDKVSENDPYNHLYYLFYSLILPLKSKPEDVDTVTILSKALKYLQLRASRIDEVVGKQAYLSRNYWNSRLMTEARKNKLL